MCARRVVSARFTGLWKPSGGEAPSSRKTSPTKPEGSAPALSTNNLKTPGEDTLTTCPNRAGNRLLGRPSQNPIKQAFAQRSALVSAECHSWRVHLVNDCSDSFTSILAMSPPLDVSGALGVQRDVMPEIGWLPKTLLAVSRELISCAL